MKPAAFEYHRVFTAAEAVDALAELDEDAKILAGGQSLAPMMNFRLARPSALVDINPVDELDFLRRDGATLVVGARTRHRTVELCTDAELLDGFAILPAAAGHIGHYPIRTRGTLGGSVAHSDPSAEWCLLARLLDAQIVLLGPDGSREVDAVDWFTGFLTTSIGPGELLTEVRFTNPRSNAGIHEFAQRKGDFAIASAAVAFDIVDGHCTNAGVVLGGVASEPFRTAELDAALEGQPPTTETWRAVADAARELINPPSDLHGDADYRRHLVGTMIVRAFEEAVTPEVDAT